jgi:hypothetical protein
VSPRARYARYDIRVLYGVLGVLSTGSHFRTSVARTRTVGGHVSVDSERILRRRRRKSTPDPTVQSSGEADGAKRMQATTGGKVCDGEGEDA